MIHLGFLYILRYVRVRQRLTVPFFAGFMSYHHFQQWIRDAGSGVLICCRFSMLIIFIGDVFVDSILYPEVPIALRLSGHLLLGVVRIYSRKVNLLFNDCSDALLKIHQAFQSSAVNLPPGAVVAPFNSITLPESFDFNDLEAHLSRENVAAQIGNRLACLSFVFKCSLLL